MHLEVLEIHENEDGSANVIFEMDQKTYQRMAELGVLKVLTDAAAEIVETRQEKLDKEFDEQGSVTAYWKADGTQETVEWISNDLPDLLRKAAWTIKDPTDTLWWKAAQEIEKLRAERDYLQQQLYVARVRPAPKKTSDVGELARRLQYFFIFDDGGKPNHPPILDEAAAMLQAQAAEIEDLKDSHTHFYVGYHNQLEKIAALTEKLEARAAAPSMAADTGQHYRGGEKRADDPDFGGPTNPSSGNDMSPPVAAQSEEKEDGRDSVAGSSGSDCPGNNERGKHPVAPPPVERGECVICIGQHTLDLLRRGEAVTVNGVTLLAADDLFQPLPPSSDVKELVGRLRDEGDKMDARFGTRLCDEAAAMLQAQAAEIERLRHLQRKAWDTEQIAALTDKLAAQAKEYEKLEAKFWEVRDAGIKAEDALERYREALVRIAQDQTSNDLNETNLVRINIARAALEEPKP